MWGYSPHPYFMQGCPCYIFFHNPPSPLLKGAPPLPVSALLRRGEKRKIAESIFRDVLVSRDDAMYYLLSRSAIFPR